MFDALFEGVSGYVVTVRLRFSVVGADVVLPPFTSRVLKQLVYSDPGFSGLRALYESSGSFRPVTFRVLRRGGVRLYAVSGGSVVVAREGEVLWGEISVFSRSPPDLESLGAGSCGVLSLGGGGLSYCVDSVTVEDLSGLSAGLDGSSVFWLHLHTPLLISTKAMTPPFALKSRFVSSLPKAYKLLPSPSYICCEAARLWLALARGERAESPLPYYAGRACDVMLAEIDYRLKPVTAVYGRDERGSLRLARGPIGYLGIKILSSRLTRFLDKTLALASRIGLGKSRSMGFGEVSVRVGGGGEGGPGESRGVQEGG